MNKTIWRIVIFIAITLIPATAAMAQDEAQSTLPAAYMMQGFTHEYQWMNNCGPATMTNALSYFGYTNTQQRAQDFLKPDINDNNVSPWQMVEFVNTQVTELPVYALQRNGGDIDTLRTLIANDFPVIIEEGYDPPNLDIGWMGHYLLLKGYDDNARTFNTHDSYSGPDYNYSYAHIEENWRHFNYTYIVLYRAEREAELLTLLGDNADEFANTMNALLRAIADAELDVNDPFAWFNIGTNYVNLARLERENGNEETAINNYNNAKLAYDRAREIGTPFRMMWYQFGIYETYYEVAQASTDSAYADGLYAEIFRVADNTIQTCKEGLDNICFIEETYYYAGLARAAMGDTDRAISNFNTALLINAKFQPAIDARDALLASQGG